MARASIVLAFALLAVAGAAAQSCGMTSGNVYRASACAGYMTCNRLLCVCAGVANGTSDSCLSMSSGNCSTFNMCAKQYVQCLNVLATGARSNATDPCNQWAVMLHAQLLNSAIGSFNGSVLQASCDARVCELKNRTNLGATCSQGMNSSMVCMAAAGSAGSTQAPIVRYAIRAQLRLGGNWTALFNDPTKRAQLLTALASDLGAYLGIAASFIRILSIALGSLIVDFAVVEGSGANLSTLESKIASAATNSSWMTSTQAFAAANGGPTTIVITSAGVTTTTTAAPSTTTTTGSISSASSVSAALVAVAAVAALLF